MLSSTAINMLVLSTHFFAIVHYSSQSTALYANVTANQIMHLIRDTTGPHAAHIEGSNPSLAGPKD